jgi:hypothetical protein
MFIELRFEPVIYLIQRALTRLVVAFLIIIPTSSDLLGKSQVNMPEEKGLCPVMMNPAPGFPDSDRDGVFKGLGLQLLIIKRKSLQVDCR